MFEGSSTILFAADHIAKKQYKVFLCQNRPKTKQRVYFDGHTVPKFAWYGQMADGTRFIAVKDGSKWGMISHRGLTTWAKDIIPEIIDFISSNSCVKAQEIKTTKFHIKKEPVIRKNNHKSRLPSKLKEFNAPSAKLEPEYKALSVAIYGETIEVNNKKYEVGTTRMSTYMDGTGMGRNFDNRDRRPMEPQFPVKSGKRK